MTSRKKRSRRMSKGEPQKGSEDMENDDESDVSKVKVSARNGRRSAAAAFGDESDQSVKSPVRKKQNTATSRDDKLASDKSGRVTRTSINNDNQTSANSHSRYSRVDPIKGAMGVGNVGLLRSSNEEKKENVLDVAPPTRKATTKPAAIAKTPNLMIAEKIVEVETAIPSPQNAGCGHMKTETDGDANVGHNLNKRGDSQNGHIWSSSLGWVGVFVFMNLFVFSGVIYSSLLLIKATSNQLESLECRERLHQAYHAMDVGVDLEDMEEDDISNRFEEQKFYWRELEGQVRYWKKEAEEFQRHGDAFREQCQEDLRHLLSELDPKNIEN